MTALQKILLIFTALSLLIGGVIIAVLVGFGPKNCDTLRPEFFISGCTTGDGLGDLWGMTMQYDVKSVLQEADETYITVEYPVIFGLSLPLRFRVGSYYFRGDRAKYVGLCQIIRVHNDPKYNCGPIDSNDLQKFVKPNDLVYLKVFNKILPEVDPYSALCEKTHHDFFEKVRRRTGLVSFLPYFRKSYCAPIVGLIYY